MEIIKYTRFFIEGSILGFATGISCAVFCVPVLIGLTSRNINKITPINDIIFFLSGRLIAYIFVGIVFSIIGIQLKFSNIIEIITNFLISGLLIYWGIKGIIDSDNGKNSCGYKKFSKTMPFLAGILTGISPCPPFIAGIARVTGAGNIIMGILFFIGFYLTTSLFLLPGLISGLVKFKKELKIIASFVSIIFGSVFLIMGIFKTIIIIFN